MSRAPSYQGQAGLANDGSSFEQLGCGDAPAHGAPFEAAPARSRSSSVELPAQHASGPFLRSQSADFVPACQQAALSAAAGAAPPLQAAALALPQAPRAADAPPPAALGAEETPAGAGYPGQPVATSLER